MTPKEFDAHQIANLYGIDPKLLPSDKVTEEELHKALMENKQKSFYDQYQEGVKATKEANHYEWNVNTASWPVSHDYSSNTYVFTPHNNVATASSTVTFGEFQIGKSSDIPQGTVKLVADPSIPQGTQYMVPSCQCASSPVDCVLHA